MPYVVRNMRKADIPAYVEFYNLTSAPDQHINEEEAMGMTFQDPKYSPERHFIALDSETEVIGADCQLDINRGFMEANGLISSMVLHYRNRAAADEVMIAAADFLSGMGISAVTTWVRAKSPVWHYLNDRSFTAVREFQVMCMRPARFQPDIPEGYTIRSARFPGEEDLFRKTINDSFRGQFAYYEMDEMDFERRYMLPEDMDRSGFYLAFAPDGTPAGVAASYLKSESAGDLRGLGVLPDHRGKGLGRALAAMSVCFFAEKGVEKVTLGVDSMNEPAIRIYSSLGFSREYTVLMVRASVKEMRESILNRGRA